jgi:TRAP-type C4-dicarboxylate transport system permease small subunit
VRAFLDGLYRISGVVAAVFLALIAALVLVQIVGRMLGVMVPSTDDIAGFFLVATSFLALAHTLKAKAHIRVELLLQRLAPGARQPVEIAALALGALITGYFAYFAIDLAWLSWRFGDMSQGIFAIPLWIPQCVMALGLIILAIAFVDELALVLRGRIAEAEAEGLEERGASSAE